MEKIDLYTNSKKIQQAYDTVVKGDSSATYVVYSVDKSAVMSVTETGDGDLNEFIEHFEDGVVQFGLARVTVPGSDVSKIIILGWCPDNAPAKSRLSFASNFAEVSKVLSGYHVQITARDQDDLDVDEFLHKVGAAAGARYSIQTAGAGSVLKKPAPKPVKPAVSKPVPTKPVVSKPTTAAVPKSTGKPVGIVDEWGGEKEIEERDFNEKPLESVPSAYKPTKVNIEELRKQKSDTISSTPKPRQEEPKEEEAQPQSFADRMLAYKSNEEGRLLSLPKPKVSHSVASRYSSNVKSEGVSFGSKPSFGASAAKKEVGGGISRDFAAQGGKTPAQLWAEKRGQYKTVPQEEAEEKAESEPEPQVEEEPEEEEPEAESSGDPEEDLVQKLEKVDVSTPPPVSLPARNLPPPPPPTRDEPKKDESPVSSLPARNLPPAPKPAEPVPEPEPVSEPEPVAEPKASGLSAVAAYDYEKDEDNEIGFAEGDVIVEIDFVDEDWWSGKHSKTGEVGLFPSSYVTLSEGNGTEAEPVVPAAATAAAQAPEPVPEPSPEASSGPSATAEYDYEKDEDNEIAFVEGDVIVDIEFVDDDWWSGKHSKTGETGLFPANYVKLNE